MADKTKSKAGIKWWTKVLFGRKIFKKNLEKYHPLKNSCLNLASPITAINSTRHYDLVIRLKKSNSFLADLIPKWSPYVHLTEYKSLIKSGFCA